MGQNANAHEKKNFLTDFHVVVFHFSTKVFHFSTLNQKVFHNSQKFSTFAKIVSMVVIEKVFLPLVFLGIIFDLRRLFLVAIAFFQME